MNINLHIDELVMKGIGLEAHQKAELKSSFEGALKKLLSQKEVIPNLHNDGVVKKINSRPISIGKNSAPSQIGKNIAYSVYEGIKR